MRSCLLSLQSKPHKLAEEVTQTCWTSLSGLLDKPLSLVEQVSWNVMSKSGPSSRLGAHAKGWALPSLGMWMWTSWTRHQAHWACWALFHDLHNLPSSILKIHFIPWGSNSLTQYFISSNTTQTKDTFVFYQNLFHLSSNKPKGSSIHSNPFYNSSRVYIQSFFFLIFGIRFNSKFPSNFLNYHWYMIRFITLFISSMHYLFCL